MGHNPPMPDDPSEIEKILILEQGPDRAMEIALEGTTTTAIEQGNYYRLSVWREVKRILRERIGVGE